MALDKPTLIEELVEAFSHPSTQDNKLQVATKMADAFEKFVKSGDVIGTCPPEGGPLIEGKVE